MARKTILIVEDDECLRDLLLDRLAEKGYRMLSSAGGHEAMDTLARETVDLVLTDLLMPGKDGIELIRDLRQSHPDLPIVAMSGGGRVDAGVYLKLARNLGARAFLEKPFSPDQLMMSIALALTNDGSKPGS